MKSGKISITVFFIVALSILTAFQSMAFAKKPIEIKASTFHPVGHTLTEDAFKWYGKEIEKRTNGQVKFTWFLACSLIPFNKTYDGLKSGIADWAYIVPSMNPNEFVLSDAINLPFAAVNSAHAAAILWQMSKEFPELLVEYKKVKPLFFYSTAPVHIHTNTKKYQPKTLEDVQGLRIACPGPALVKYMNILGIAGQQMQPFDLYTAVQRGMLDGVMFPEAPLRSQKLTDLLDYHLMMSIGVDVMTVSMNMNTWKKLPKDVQQVFLDISESAGALFGATITNESAWVMDELEKRGDVLHYLSDVEKQKMKKKLQPVYDEWFERMAKKGMDGKKVLKRVEEIAEETLNNPYKPDDWWSKAGKKN